MGATEHLQQHAAVQRREAPACTQHVPQQPAAGECHIAIAPHGCPAAEKSLYQTAAEPAQQGAGGAEQHAAQGASDAAADIDADADLPTGGAVLLASVQAFVARQQLLRQVRLQQEAKSSGALRTSVLRAGQRLRSVARSARRRLQAMRAGSEVVDAGHAQQRQQLLEHISLQERRVAAKLHALAALAGERGTLRYVSAAAAAALRRKLRSLSRGSSMQRQVTGSGPSDLIGTLHAECVGEEDRLAALHRQLRDLDSRQGPPAWGDGPRDEAALRASEEQQLQQRLAAERARLVRLRARGGRRAGEGVAEAAARVSTLLQAARQRQTIARRAAEVRAAAVLHAIPEGEAAAEAGSGSHNDRRRMLPREAQQRAHQHRLQLVADALELRRQEAARMGQGSGSRRVTGDSARRSSGGGGGGQHHRSSAGGTVTGDEEEDGPRCSDFFALCDHGVLDAVLPLQQQAHEAQLARLVHEVWLLQVVEVTAGAACSSSTTAAAAVARAWAAAFGADLAPAWRDELALRPMTRDEAWAVGMCVVAPLRACGGGVADDDEAAAPAGADQPGASLPD